jgi:putative SOS response-associated peptidase YedK
MCSHYQLKARLHDLARRFRFTLVEPPEERDDIRPTDTAPVVTGDGRLRLLAWGLPSKRDGKPLINARAESLTNRPTFRMLVENRCLVPATAYFEWRRDGRARFRNRIAAADGSPFAFAGLFNDTFFTIVTCAPGPDVRPIHDRMPVILGEADEAAWIDPARPFADVRSLLRPSPEGRLAVVEEMPRNVQPSLF